MSRYPFVHQLNGNGIELIVSFGELRRVLGFKVFGEGELISFRYAQRSVIIEPISLKYFDTYLPLDIPLNIGMNLSFKFSFAAPRTIILTGDCIYG